MTTVTFDTHLAVKRLVKLGYKEPHAEEFVKIFQEGKEIDTSKLATKADLDKFATKADLVELKVEMLKWFIATTFIIVSIMISGFGVIINVLKP